MSRPTPELAYDHLVRRSREVSILASCLTLLDWDEQTYMPPGGADNRADQMAYLAGLQHEKSADPRIGDWLAEVEASDLVADPELPSAVNITQWRRQFQRLSRLPRDLVERQARAASLGQQAWHSAKQDCDFAAFRPFLEKVIQLKREEAACLVDGDATSSYDALLDEYEPGCTAAQLRPLFHALRSELDPLRERLAGRRRSGRVSLLRRNYPVDRQRVFCETVAETLGYDFHRGRLDPTSHPFFAAMGPGDCRITTRFYPHQFSESLNATLHEMGHALYEQGLDPNHVGTPAGESGYLALHESQARFWENKVGRSRAFWQHFFPLARKFFHDVLHDASLDDVYRAVNEVSAGPIRVGADEVTYDMHILVRFELEQVLLTGELAVADLPAAWNEKYQQHLGVTPANDAEGCLQDSHWGSGMFGYYPAYTLGNVLAAQLFQQADRDLGGAAATMAKGEFAPLLDWLRENVHRHGQRYSAAELIERITGSPPDHRPLVAALEEKYEGW